MHNHTFKEIAKIFNDSMEGVTFSESSEPRYIKEDIFRKLKRSFPILSMTNIDTHTNQFKVIFPFKHGYREFDSFGEGEVGLVFAIRTKKTDKLKTISPTKKKYIHTAHPKPFTFKYYYAQSYVPSYDWHDEDKHDLFISSSPGRSSNSALKKIEGNTAEELIAEIEKTYDEAFSIKVVQPYLHLLSASRFNENLLDRYPSDFRDFIQKCQVEQKNIFDALVDFIIENNLIVHNK